MSNTPALLIPEDKAIDVFTLQDGLDPYLKEIREEVTAFVADISTEKGRKEVASLAYKVTKSKTALDNIGKTLVSKLKEQPKLVDAERKRMREVMDALRDEVRKPLTDWEEAEEARAAIHTATIGQLWSLHDNRDNRSAEELKNMLQEAGAFIIDESLQEFQGKALIVKNKTLEALHAEFDKQTAIEAEREELEQLRQESAERKQKERDEKIAKDAEDRIKTAAEETLRKERELADLAAREAEEESKRQEKALNDAVEEAERQRLEAQEREKQAVIDTEERLKKEQLAKEEKEAAAKEKRESNKRHAAKINNQTVKSFIDNGYSEGQAKELVVMIAKGLIKNVFINY